MSCISVCWARWKGGREGGREGDLYLELIQEADREKRGRTTAEQNQHYHHVTTRPPRSPTLCALREFVYVCVRVCCADFKLQTSRPVTE